MKEDLPAEVTLRDLNVSWRTVSAKALGWEYAWKSVWLEENEGKMS
jgi:hypothetical protein